MLATVTVAGVQSALAPGVMLSQEWMAVKTSVVVNVTARPVIVAVQSVTTVGVIASHVGVTVQVSVVVRSVVPAEQAAVTVCVIARSAAVAVQISVVVNIFATVVVTVVVSAAAQSVGSVWVIVL